MISDIMELIDKFKHVKTNILIDISDLNTLLINNKGLTIFHLNIRSSKNFHQLIIMLDKILKYMDCIILT